MKVKVSNIQDIALDVKMFTLVSLDETKLPLFQAGAHIELSIDLKGSTLIRHYSLVSDPQDLSHYKIAVLKSPNSSGGSLSLHEFVCINDVIEISEPKNDFNLSNKGKHSILIAGGIGITPIYSFARQLMQSQNSFELHYAARSSDRMAFKDVIEKKFGHLTSFYIDSNRLIIEDLLKNTKIKESDIYVCGPRPMIEEVKSVAQKLGWKSSQIHFESFGNKTSQENIVKVELAKSGKIIDVKSGSSILDAILESGIDIGYSCKRGQCGCCKTKVLDGQIEHRDVCLTEDERNSDMCPCVSISLGEYLKLDI